MHLYALASAPVSAGFRNRLRLAMIPSGKAVVKSLGEIMQGCEKINADKFGLPLKSFRNMKENAYLCTQT